MTIMEETLDEYLIRKQKEADDELRTLQNAVREFLEIYHTGPSVMEDQLIKRMEELVK